MNQCRTFVILHHENVRFKAIQARFSLRTSHSLQGSSTFVEFAQGAFGSAGNTLLMILKSNFLPTHGSSIGFNLDKEKVMKTMYSIEPFLSMIYHHGKKTIRAAETESQSKRTPFESVLMEQKNCSTGSALASIARGRGYRDMLPIPKTKKSLQQFEIPAIPKVSPAPSWPDACEDTDKIIDFRRHCVSVSKFLIWFLSGTY